MSSHTSTIVETSLCRIRIDASDKGICRIQRVTRSAKVPKEKPTQLLRDAAQAVQQYCDGNARALESIPLDICGTDFQMKVWRALKKIPLGEVRSYAEIAKAIGRPNAARAVGTACGKNPVLLAIPCHRVIASNGSLGGFAAGLPLKESLLSVESGHTESGRA